MEKRTPMGHSVPRHIVLSSGDRGNSASNRRGTPEPHNHANSRRNRRSARSQFHNRFGYGSTVLPIWYHVGTATIALTIIIIAVILGIIGE